MRAAEKLRTESSASKHARTCARELGRARGRRLRQQIKGVMKEDRRGSLRGRSWTCLEPPGGEAPVMEIDGDGAVAVAGKTTRWRGCEGLQLEPKVVGDADEANGAAEHNLTGRGRLRPWERR